MAKLNHFDTLVERFASVADFCIVYIEEAHPLDGWAFRNNPYAIRQHQTQVERLKAAYQLADTHPRCPILVDTMDNTANYNYGALYERLYIVLDGRVVYSGDRGPQGYKLEEVEVWLEGFMNSKLSSSSSED